jgi:hypothetical protein
MKYWHPHLPIGSTFLCPHLPSGKTCYSINNPCTAIPGSIMLVAYNVMSSEDKQTSS